MDKNLDIPNIGFDFSNHLAQPLVIIGALNWGLISAFNFDLVRTLFGFTTLASIVYGIIGVAGLIQAFAYVKSLAR